MSVYVDCMFSCRTSRKWRYPKASHLFADSEKELLEFGRKIGLKPGWLQRGVVTHFDITPNVRERAVRAGAIQVDRKFVYERIKAARKAKADSEAKCVTGAGNRGILGNCETNSTER